MTSIKATAGEYAEQFIHVNECLIVHGKDGELVTLHNSDADLTTDFNGEIYLSEFCVLADIGVHEGQFIPKNQSRILASHNICHEDDEILVTKCGNEFLEEEMDDECIVMMHDGCYAYEQDCVMTHCGNYADECDCRLVRISSCDEAYVLESNLDEVIYCDETNEYYLNDYVARYCGIVYDDHEGEYVTEETYCQRQSEREEEEEKNECIRDYHHFSRVSKREENCGSFSIGLEIEKEDVSERDRENATHLYEKFGWCKERDGSLNERTGFECVSPIYSLFGQQLAKDLDCLEIKRIVNANYSEDCGGHINLSGDNYSPMQLFEGLSAYLPLLYCLYEKRKEKRWCQAKKKTEMAVSRDKYNAVYIRDNRIEFRIFPAVKNVDNLLWRVNLIRIMVETINSSELQVFRMMMNKRSKLYKHLSLVLTEEKITEKCVKYVEYSKFFNDKNIDGMASRYLVK